MRVLWITNIAIPQIAEQVAMRKVSVGGWMVKLADEIANVDGMELCIAFPYEKVVEGKVGKLTYASFHVLKNDEKKQDYGFSGARFKYIINKYSPDVIHIHGTEHVHSFIVTEICRKLEIDNKIVISIQGLVSVYRRHYEAYLEKKIVQGKTIRDLYAGNIVAGKRKFYDLGKFEVKAIKNVKHIIGRTDWDKACAFIYNPEALYHFNNEMLRNCFYQNQWKLDCCVRHTIFMSQATMPIKGLHLGLEAVNLLKRNYPDVHLVIAGKSYYEKSKWRLSYYEKYILNYIKENGLQKHVEFTDFLSETAICDRFLKSHIFVSASSIENSPNSLCEAMILGVPTVTSMVGGIQNLLQHGKEGFYYQADAPYMLAYYIRKIFNDDKLANIFSNNSRKTAMERHDPDAIVNGLLDIYKIVSSN